MSNHKCNNCMSQAIVKYNSHNSEYCLSLDIEIKDIVKNCTEFINKDLIQEPDDFVQDLENLVTMLKSKPTMNQVRKRIQRIKIKIDLLRAWGRQKLKPKIKK